MPRSGYTICTSEQRPTSTTVSHGFIVERYSSPPFGSHGTCKHSEPCLTDGGTGGPCSTRPPSLSDRYLHGMALFCTIGARAVCLHRALWLFMTRQHANSIDSLIRVSRRAEGGPGQPKPGCGAHSHPAASGRRAVHTGATIGTGAANPTRLPKPQSHEHTGSLACPKAHQVLSSTLSVGSPILLPLRLVSGRVLLQPAPANSPQNRLDGIPLCTLRTPDGLPGGTVCPGFCQGTARAGLSIGRSAWPSPPPHTPKGWGRGCCVFPSARVFSGTTTTVPLIQLHRGGSQPPPTPCVGGGFS